MSSSCGFCITPRMSPSASRTQAISLPLGFGVGEQEVGPDPKGSVPRCPPGHAGGPHRSLPRRTRRNRFTQRDQPELSALVLSGPVIGGNPQIEGMLGLNPLPEVPIDPSILSRDPAVGEAYASDERRALGLGRQVMRTDSKNLR